MQMIRILPRVLAAAVPAAWMLASMPASAAMSCRADSFTVQPGTSGTLVVNCDAPSTSTPPPTTTPPPPPPPTGTGNIAADCAARGFNSVVPVEMGWKSWMTHTRGFTSSAVAVVHFRTPSAIAPGASGKITATEYGGGARKRHAVLSTAACDFNKPAAPSLWGPFLYADNSSPTIFFAVGGTSTRSFTALAPNTDYYFNVKNDPEQCPAGSTCEMSVELTKPLGL